MGRRSQPTKAEDIMEALRLLRFLNPVYESSQLSELKLHLVHDYTDCSVLLARLLSERSVEMASPEAHLKNMMLLNKDLGKRLRQHYYGSETAPKSVFAHCKTHVEVFNQKQTIEVAIQRMLHRFGCAISEQGKPLLSTQGRFDLPVLTQHILKHNEPDKLTFVSFITYNSFVVVNEWYNKGVEIPALGRKRIRPMYQVWSPTFQDYINMLAAYLAAEPLSGQALDIGSGTGVLAFLLAQKGLSVTALDNHADSVECTRLNAANLGFQVQVIQGDIVEPPDLPRYNVITCNPPWLPTTLEGRGMLLPGLFDENERMLKGCIRFAGSHLLPEGRLLLIYSDLAGLIGLHAADRIEQLSALNGLRVHAVERRRNNRPIDSADPFSRLKESSHFLLYDIRLS